PDELLRTHEAPVVERDGLAALEHAALRSERDAESVRGGVVEPAGPLRLDEGVADCRHTVRDRERADLAALERHRVAAPERQELRLVSGPHEHAGEHAEELPESGRAVDAKRGLAHPQRERLQHPREAEVMVRVKMAQEDVLEVDEPDRGAEELAL